MGDELRFVQFPHPGGEHRPDGDGWKAWNVGDHARKFMVCPGRWRETPDGPDKDGPIVFWGEWEPPSRVLTTYAAVGRGWPRYLYEPVWHSPPETGFLQNTDPYVFGDWFRYSNCRQNTRKSGPRSSQRLAVGSLILFGSKLDRDFVLDTVLVVGDAQHLNHDVVDDVEGIDPAFRATVCDVLYRGAYIDDTNRLYRGATAAQSVDGMFSFVPCLPSEMADRGFPRPPIRLPSLVNPSLAMNYKMTAVDAVDVMRSIWDETVDQVLEHGLCLGTHLATPDRMNQADAVKDSARTRC